MANPADENTPEMQSTILFYAKSTIAGKRQMANMTIPRFSTIISPVILTMGELSTIYSINFLQESHDRTLINSFYAPSKEALTETLTTWASLGFPNPYPFCKFTMNPPELCSDGVKRDFFQYFRYLTGKKFEDYNSTFEALMPGFVVIHHHTENILTYFVIKP
jgi:hypothetical protein